jgi:DNA-binding MarR family transcriptional regulator
MHDMSTNWVYSWPVTKTRWLTAEEFELWTSYMRVQKQLFAALNRQLQADSGLSLSDWDVLVALTADPSGSQRVGDLANTLGWERSRLSHHAARMQKRGLLERVECLEDGRGASYELTSAGWRASRAAAPKHVETVRQLFLDPLDPAQIAPTTAALQQIVARLERASSQEL